MTHHLLGVWNPSYAADAMEAHLRMLLENIKASRLVESTRKTSACSGE